MEENEGYQKIVYKYIQEASDEELLSDEVRDKIPPFTSFPGEFNEEYSQIRSLEMMRRLKNAIQDLTENVRKGNEVTEKASRTTNLFSVVLIFIGTSQFIIILFQFIFSIAEGNNKLYGSLLFFIVSGFILWIIFSFRKIEKILNRN